MSSFRNLISKSFDILAEVKVYFGNASLYLSIANFIMILATFKLAYKIDISAYILVPVGFLGVLLIGWLDYQFIFKRQTRHVNKKNDIKMQLDEMEKKLEELNRKIDSKNKIK